MSRGLRPARDGAGAGVAPKGELMDCPAGAPPKGEGDGALAVPKGWRVGVDGGAPKGEGEAAAAGAGGSGLVSPGLPKTFLDGD